MQNNFKKSRVKSKPKKNENEAEQRLKRS